MYTPLQKFFQAEGSRDSTGKRETRVTRKHVIIGVTCALVTALMITGVLVGVKFYLDSASQLVTVFHSSSFFSFASQSFICITFRYDMVIEKMC